MKKIFLAVFAAAVMVLALAAFAPGFSAADTGPWKQTAEIADPGTGKYDGFGNSVAVSGDGRTALACGMSGAYIYAQYGGTWTQQAELDGDCFDYGIGSVQAALSADGNTAAVYGHDPDLGDVVFVYVRSGGSWTKQGMVGAVFLSGVALSGDGNTLAVGSVLGCGEIFYQGTATVYARSGGTWTKTADLADPDGATDGGGCGYGWSVALSGDGATALVGSPSFGSASGAAYVFGQSGGSWTQTAKLAVSGVYSFGWSVALSGDGATALVGSPSYGSASGAAAYVFAQSGGSWVQEAKLTPAAADNQFGLSVALSSDGDSALSGGNGTGYVFGQPGGAWTQTAWLMVSGGAVALSGDGSTALIGAAGADGGAGAVYIFSAPMPAATHFSVTAPATATAGVPFSLTVTALDDDNNPVSGYAGTVRFTSTDATAVLPSDATLTDGAGTFSVTLNEAGSQTVMATDTATASITGASGGIQVSAPVPVNGSCGSSDGGSFTAAPTADLCDAGTASAVTGSGPWSWSCGGINGGTTANCSAKVQQWTVTATAGTGGKATPATQMVNDGGLATVTLTPNAGYGISSVMGCSGALNGSTYTTGPIDSDCTVTVIFGLTYKISGTVKNAAGAGMANVVMTLTRGDGTAVATVKTDATGSYRFKGLVDGTYTVTPSKTGKVFTPESRAVEVSGGNATVKKFKGKKATD